MPKPVLCISKSTFKIGQGNAFKIYGDNLDAASNPVTLTVELASTTFDWTPNKYVVDDNNRKKHFVLIHSTPSRRPGPAPVGTTDDDLTVTLTFDEGGPDEDVTEEDYEATYEDP